jgi:hypothetical protein
MDKVTIKAALEAIAAECGGVLRPEDVVRRASDPTHPLHGSFEWNDGAAAKHWRLDQARMLIRSVRIVIHPREEAPVQQLRLAPAFVRDPGKGTDQQGYVPIVTLRTDLEKARDVLANEMSRVEAALNRALAVASVLNLQDELADLLERVTAFGRLIPTAHPANAETPRIQ